MHKKKAISCCQALEYGNGPGLQFYNGIICIKKQQQQEDNVKMPDTPQLVCRWGKKGVDHFIAEEMSQTVCLSTEERYSLLINTSECLFLHMMHVMLQTAGVIG